MEKLRILIIGSSGMLGHQLAVKMSNLPGIYVTCAARHHDRRFIEKFAKNEYVTLSSLSRIGLQKLLQEARPDYVLNCVGVIKQIKQVPEEKMIAINSALPHILASLSQKMKFRLIHFSTDCVFRGDKGMYTELDAPDATDLYGKTKALGEISDNDCVLTLRTSIIGHELRGFKSLLEWFLRHEQGPINGFVNAKFSGQTTNDLARKILEIILKDRFQPGLFQCGSTPIDKYHLLSLINEIYGLQKTIVENQEPVIDRTLSTNCFFDRFQISQEPWHEQLTTMRNDHLAFGVL